MATQHHRRQAGFTLIELLIVVAIIGLIAALLIPNFLDAMQKAKQKRTVADMRNVGTAMMSWLTDQVGAAAAGGQLDFSDYTGDLTSAAAVSSVLVSQYIQEVSLRDGWKARYVYNLNSVTPLAPHVALICSKGRDFAGCSGTYTSGAFDPTDYDQDIVWADGVFIRWPQKMEGTPTIN